MQFPPIILLLAGRAGLTVAGTAANPAAQSFADLGDGFYTVPIENGTLVYGSAVRDADLESVSGDEADSQKSEDKMPGDCVPAFPSMTLQCRVRDMPLKDLKMAKEKFLDWIQTGPEDGWVERKSCKSVIVGQAVVSACSTKGRQPTCRDEFNEAMGEIDPLCKKAGGGDLYIKKWRKIYNRHNVRDGDGLASLISDDDGGGDDAPPDGAAPEEGTAPADGAAPANGSAPEDDGAPAYS
ncbi:hypothetical protein GGR52DRAFT_538942 [Hypoxylon sp. FL1284]|nr:hypothetical protein GGR52DRAFT_538942 [Hypoxylon sp. FL1284]